MEIIQSNVYGQFVVAIARETEKRRNQFFAEKYIKFFLFLQLLYAVFFAE
jgi:hypothetical protein